MVLLPLFRGMSQLGKIVSPWALAPLLFLSGMAACGGDAGRDEPSQAAAEAAAAPRAEGAQAASQTNSPPLIEQVRFEPEEPTAGQALRVVVEATDADGDPLYIRHTWKLAGVQARSETSKLLLRGARKGDQVEVSVVASDGQDESAPVRMSVSVANAAPELHRIEIDPAGELMAGMPIVARPQARDADGDPVSFRYQWRINGVPVAEEGPVLETDRMQRGDTAQLVVIATDGEDESDPLETPELRIENSPPRIVSKPGPMTDGSFYYAVKAEDPDGNRNLRFHLEDAPDGMSVDPLSGVVTWTPAPDQTGTHSFRVLVDDLEGGRGRQTLELAVSAEEEGPPPAKPQ